MPDQPGQPVQPDPPEEWRVYKSDPTPDPEPAQQSPYAPPGAHVPYGSAQPPYAAAGSTPVKTSAAPKLILVMILVAVVGVGVAAAVAIFAAVGDGIGLGGIDAKDPGDFAKLVGKLQDDKGTTKVQQVGFYTDYDIVYLPYSDDPTDTRQVSYTWRGGDLEVWTKSTSTDPVFDLKDIDTDVIDGMCDPVLKMADGANLDDCYIFLSKPSDGNAWFRTSASDDFGRSYWVNYDIEGNEVERGHS